MPTLGTGFGNGDGIIIHAVGVPGAGSFLGTAISSVPKARRRQAGWFRKNEGGALLRQGGALKLVAEVRSLGYNPFPGLLLASDRRSPANASQHGILSLAPAGRIMRRVAARTSAFSTASSSAITVKRADPQQLRFCSSKLNSRSCESSRRAIGRRLKRSSSPCVGWIVKTVHHKAQS